MATSGSINLVATGTNIIEEALELCGALHQGQSADANQLSSANRSLNYMVKAWQAESPNLFALQSLTLFLEQNKNKYSLVSTTTDHFTTTAEVIHTELAVAGVATDGTITVDDDTGMSNGDVIGIELDDGTMQWTTINGAPAANVVTLTTALTGAAAIDNTVYTYTNKADRPMKIVHAQLEDEDNKSYEMEILPYDKYAQYSDKTTDGKVVAIYYDPQVGTGSLYVWPESDTETDRLILWAQRTLDDIDTVATDDLDYPQEWYMALAYGLAVILADKYGLSMGEKKSLMDSRDYYKDRAEGYDRDPYTSIIPDFDWEQ